MLSQDEFTALLQRYLAGQHTVAEHHLLAQWVTQAAEPGQLELSAEELAQVRAAMWQRIEEATQENQ
jgi:transposase-like protein